VCASEVRDGVRGEVRAQVVRPSMPIPRIKIENLLACLRGNPVRKRKLKSAPYFAISIQRRYFSGFESAFREEKRAIDKIPDGNAAIINDIQLSPTSFRPELREAAPSIGFGPFQLYPAARILLWTGPRLVGKL
jgi:hypothetical protein